MMGVEPARLTIRQYLGVLAEWNARHSKDGAKPETREVGDMSRLARAMAAHSVH